MNDLATTHPRLAAQWHRDLNVHTPAQLSAGSNTKVWWVCQVHGHRWRAMVHQRARSGTGCPVCAGLVIEPGFNDLATLHPAVAAMWHSERNEQTPQQVSPGSHRVVWWHCQAGGHEWQSRIERQVTRVRCPHCPDRIHPAVVSRRV